MLFSHRRTDPLGETMQAGMHAVRKNRYVILPKDFEKV